MLIRAFRSDDTSAVRTLFERVNRELAPPELRERFEQYISIALRDEIDRIPGYYGSSPGRGFWVAEDPSGALIGFFGLEPAGEDSSELRRMYVAPECKLKLLALLCSNPWPLDRSVGRKGTGPHWIRGVSTRDSYAAAVCRRNTLRKYTTLEFDAARGALSCARRSGRPSSRNRQLFSPSSYIQ